MTSQAIDRRIHWKPNGQSKVSACANIDPRNARILACWEISFIATTSVEKATDGAFRKFLIVKADPCLPTV